MVALLSSSFAYACSCMRSHSTPDKIETTPVIFHGKVKRQLWRGIPFFSERKTIFTVTKSYKGDLNKTAEIFHPIDLGGNCGLSFGRKLQGLIFAYLNEEGELGTSSCAMHSRYSDLQFIEYFENKFDSSELDIFCSWYIDEAYAEEKKSGEFNLKDEKCLNKKDTYDKLYLNAGAKR